MTMLSQNGSPSAAVYCSSSDVITETPMSRTHQYRKVMKPLLERKRRARINACLDELKDLMVYALQAEGESISKLEKADVLELTVRHLRKLKRQQMLVQNPGLDLDRFHAGYTACASEVGKCMQTVPGMNPVMTTRLMGHLNQRLAMHTTRSSQPAAKVQHPVTSPLILQSPPPYMQPSSEQKPRFLSPNQSTDSDLGYASGRDSTPSPTNNCMQPQDLSIHSQVKSEPRSAESEPVWRPF